MMNLENPHPIYTVFHSAYDRAYMANYTLYQVKKKYIFMDQEIKRDNAISIIFESQHIMQDRIVSMGNSELDRDTRLEYILKMQEYFPLVNGWIEEIRKN